MRVASTQASGRCRVSNKDVFQGWLKQRSIDDVEVFVPDMAGSARGKVIPADKLGKQKKELTSFKAPDSRCRRHRVGICRHPPSRATS